MEFRQDLKRYPSSQVLFIFAVSEYVILPEGKAMLLWTGKKVMQKKRFTRPFRRLRGKLTLSYTLTSVAAFLLVEIIAISVLFGFLSANTSTLITNQLKQEAAQTAPYFVHGSPDPEELTAWLHIISTAISNNWPILNKPIFIAVTDSQGRVIASVGTQPLAAGTALQTQLSPQNQANLRRALNDTTATSTVAPEAGHTLVAITPIVGVGENVQGTLAIKILQPDIFQLAAGLLQVILLSMIVVTALAAIAGLIFGSLNARGLTRRLTGLSTAANRWSEGDFSALVHDTSEDELGQLAQQLNSMAEQLQQLLQTRQKLATLEERNRLARDLHDSVKQQIFAISMQIAAVKVLLKKDADAAEARLNEAEKLVRQTQQELTSLIRELRPVALEDKGLVQALREMATAWSQQTGIVANVRIEGAPTLSLSVEEALFRIAQEALSNVARHSKATLVQLHVVMAGETISLSVIDNGQGFDMTRKGDLGVGLLSIRERVKALGGDADIESTPGKGTVITAYCKRSGTGVNTTTADGEEHKLTSLNLPAEPR